VSNPNSFQGYTVEDFIHGDPTDIMIATQRPKILVLWPHGNERLGPRIGHHIATERPDLLRHVDYMCGSPQAAALRPDVRKLWSYKVWLNKTII
jgi:hypothetical protein